MQFTQVAYGGCWKCPHDWQRCSASTPRLAASQKGFVHSFGTGIGLVTLLQSLIVISPLAPASPAWPLSSATSTASLLRPCACAQRARTEPVRRRADRRCDRL